MLDQLFAQQRYGVDRLRDVARTLRRRERAGDRHVVARAGPGLQVSHGHQPVIGIGHGVLGHAMLDGASPYRGQALPRLERAAGDQAGDLFNDCAHATHGGSCSDVECAYFVSGTVLQATRKLYLVLSRFSVDYPTCPIAGKPTGTAAPEQNTSGGDMKTIDRRSAIKTLG